MPDRICDVCAGLLGLTPYDPRLDGPHAQTDAYDAVRLLTGAEPLTAVRARRRCRWCSRPGAGGWCGTCSYLFDSAAHAAGRTLLPAVSSSVFAVAAQAVTDSSAVPTG